MSWLLVDWSQLLFPLLIALAVLYLIREERTGGRFRLIQLVSDPSGYADKYSFAYVGAFLVSTWALYTQQRAGDLKEWMLYTYVGAFVLGGAWKSGTATFERIGLAKAARPQPDPPDRASTATGTTTE